jgi:preprotein translocase subunit SecA
MIEKVLRKIFGSRNDRLLKGYRRTVRAINALEPQMQAMSDEQLAGQTVRLRERLAAGETLDALLPEAFATVREAAWRVLHMRHFDVQLIGGMVLHAGKIAEMRTGEGKTLVATLPAYLNALPGKGVHVVTVNEYLAQRDAEWMGRVFRFLGMTVGVNLSNQPRADKQAAYAADITYGTNNEFGFDYLRNNMVMSVEERLQRPLHYAIVDEVDSILIDEARTPLIISGQAEDRTDLYVRMNTVVPQLNNSSSLEAADGDFTVDEKNHQVLLTESGHDHAEQILAQAGMLAEGSSLYAPENISLIHHLYAALRAHQLFFRDRHYVVQAGEVVIVDEFTGRLMTGRRWSDGLHQAVEAKEGVQIQSENQTLASITFQNYFRMYEKLAGMTGTADTEAFEFQEIYALETVVIPTHNPMVRDDRLDQVFRTATERDNAVIRDIVECHGRGQPVLVGTTSVEASEHFSRLLDAAGLRKGIGHQVLNAKEHEREAHIVAQAGRPGMITIATNMAGRGTDIVLGGNVEKQAEHIEADASLADEDKAARIAALRAEWEGLHAQVLAAGGLHIIGTERHESRRIDNQLRGRAGRQGDPGSSRFFLSLEDPLLRIFAGERIQRIMQMLKMPEDEPIEAGIVTRSIESAQRKVEAHNFDIRKQLLEYDNVANDQRKTIYEQRNHVLDGSDAEIDDLVKRLREGVVEDFFRQHVPEDSVEEQWDLDGLARTLAGEILVEAPLADWAKEGLDDVAMLERTQVAADEAFASRTGLAPAETLSQYKRLILLQLIDHEWREHLGMLDQLRQGIHLRGYAQKNPRQEYKREGFELFAALIERVKLEATRTLMRVQVRSQEEVERAEALQAEAAPQHVEYRHPSADETLAAEAAAMAQEGFAAAVNAPPRPVQQVVNPLGKIGRNDPCPCGSGKKYKQCHGKLS